MEECLENPAKKSVFNYVDGPDFTMKELVIDIKKFYLKISVSGYLFQYLLVCFLGFSSRHFIDNSREKLAPVSLIRVKKFCAHSTFSSNKKRLNNFREPIPLKVALKRTLESEFINPRSKNSKVLYGVKLIYH